MINDSGFRIQDSGFMNEEVWENYHGVVMSSTYILQNDSFWYVFMVIFLLVLKILCIVQVHIADKYLISSYTINIKNIYG